jgi:hypothetical protein
VSTWQDGTTERRAGGEACGPHVGGGRDAGVAVTGAGRAATHVAGNSDGAEQLASVGVLFFDRAARPVMGANDGTPLAAGFLFLPDGDFECPKHMPVAR